MRLLLPSNYSALIIAVHYNSLYNVVAQKIRVARVCLRSALSIHIIAVDYYNLDYSRRVRRHKLTVDVCVEHRERDVTVVVTVHSGYSTSSGVGNGGSVVVGS